MSNYGSRSLKNCKLRFIFPASCILRCLMFISLCMLFLVSCRASKIASKTNTQNNSNSNQQNNKKSTTQDDQKQSEEASDENIYDFDYSFLNDGDIEIDEALKEKYTSKKSINKYQSQTEDSKIEKPIESKRSIKKDILYNTKKGIKMDLDKNEAMFLGEGNVVQGETIFKAGEIKFNWDKKFLRGRGRKINKTLYSPPVIQQNKDYYLAKLALYNTDTEKAYARNIISPQKEGILRAKKLKKVTEKHFYAEDAQFTTCRLEHPHFSINTNKAKIIRDDRVISGPFYMKLGGISTPLGFFYSVFRINEKRESGFLFPDVGLNSVKGFYINDYGYYFAINDYLGLAIKSGYDSQNGDIYFKIPFQYCKRYCYKGNIDYEWKLEKFRDIHIINWNHSTEPRPWGSINANVNAKFEIQEERYKAKYKERDEDNRTSADVNYNCPNFLWSPYNLNLNLHHDKKFGRTIDEKDRIKLTIEEKESEKDSTRIVMPKVSLKSRDFYIFSFLNKYSFPDVVTNINFNHSIDLKYERSRIRDFGKFLKKLFEDPTKTLKEGRSDKEILDPKEEDPPITHYGMMHTIPLKTNFTVFKHFMVTPNFTWKDRWYLDKFEYTYSSKYKKVIKKDKVIDGFHRVGEYSLGGNIQTNLEWIHYFAKENLIRAFRHKITPILGFNYSPGFGRDDSECFQRVFNHYTNKLEKKYLFDDLYGHPTIDAQALMTIQIKNVLELKIRDSENSEKSKTLKLLKSLDFSTGYDFLAEKYKLQNLKLSASTSFWDDHVNIKTDFEIDPYVYGLVNGEMEKIDDFAWNHGKFLGELRKARLNAEINLNPKKDEKEENKKPKRLSAQKYTDFDIPWNLRISYNIEYHKLSPVEKIERELEDNRIKGLDPNKVMKPHSNITTHNIHFDGDINLTKKWKLLLSVLYNIKQNKFEQPKIGISRDLHCWELRIDWTPLHYRQSLDFVLKVKANILSSIKYRSRGKL
ncbi:MAG: hypothetical protein GY830_10610 [Bacteroidetes bacterium]|nr:hypothetical protein [Bacteroidota bacterium]